MTFPTNSEDYVHRIGRTARANNDGVAITFVSEKEQGNFKNIEKFLDRDIYKIPVPEELGEAPEYKPRAFDGGRRAAVETDVSQEKTRTAVTIVKVESPEPNVHRMAARRNKHCGEEKK